MKNSHPITIIITISIIIGFISASVGFPQDKMNSKPFRLKNHSSFIPKIDDRKDDAINPPEDAVLFRWDFSGNKVYAYHFSQKVVSQNLISSFGPEKEDRVSNQNVTGDGVLSYKSGKDNTARFVLENLVLKSEMKTESADSKPKTIEMKSPPMIIQGVKEDGNLAIPSSSQTLLLKLLFPLPEKPLKVSETISVEVNMPFNAMGSLLYVNGHSKITLSKFVEISGHKCAKLISNIDISKLDIPPELEGKYTVFAKGKSVFYFDLLNRKFIEGKLALLMAMDIETKSPQVDFKNGDEKSTDLPETIKMAMNNDIFVSLSIIE